MLFARARSLRSARNLVVTACIAATAVGAAPIASAAEVAEDPALSSRGYSFKRSEACFMKRVNRARRARGYRALNWDKQVSYVARRHASSIASRRSVTHDYSLGEKVTRWRRLGQNTGRGSRCKSLFRSFIRSSKHRANIFGRWRHMGVGTARAGGRLYVQHVFESRRDPGNIYRYP